MLLKHPLSEADIIKLLCYFFLFALITVTYTGSRSLFHYSLKAFVNTILVIL